MNTKLELELTQADLEVLDEWRGDISREEFMVFLLRLVTSGAVSNVPRDLALATSQKMPAGEAG